MPKPKLHYALWDKYTYKDHTYSVVFSQSLNLVTIHIDSFQLEQDIKDYVGKPKLRLHLERDTDLHNVINMNNIIMCLYQEGIDLPTKDYPVVAFRYQQVRGYFI